MTQVKGTDPAYPFEWHEGAPPHPFCTEWFLAKLKTGERVVLLALPEEYTYDFKTADETYYMKDRIHSWMQFPDSFYVPFKSSETHNKTAGAGE